MNTQATRSIDIRLEFVDADPQHSDPVHTSDIARASVQTLRDVGYTVTPVYTGTKGANVFTVVTQTLYENKDILIALAGLATPIVTHLLNRKSKAKDPEDAMVSEATVEVVVENVSITMPPDLRLTSDDLLQRLLAADPALPSKVTPTKPLMIRARVTPRLHRRG